MKSLKLLLTIPLVILALVLSSRVIRLSPAAIVNAQNIAKIPAELLNKTANGAEVEFFIILKYQADLSGATQRVGKAKVRYVYEQLWKTAQTSQTSLRAWLDKSQISYQSFYIANALLAQGNRDLLLALAARTDVARLEENPQIYGLQLPSKVASLPTRSRPYHAQTQAIETNVSYVNADDVWALGYIGQNIVIGGQDTGYQWDHPALINQYRGFSGTAVTHDYNWHDSIYTTTHASDCGSNAPVPCDDNDHGTHTMGTALGDDGVGNQIGLAPGAQWIGCRNMDEGWGTPATYLACFEFFLAPYPLGGTSADGVPELAPDVTINSWSCPSIEGCTWETLQLAIEAQRAAGIMTVVAAGNNGSSCSTIHTPPGLYDAAYSVGALINGSDNLVSFSSRGPVVVDDSERMKPDLAAPGTHIRSSIRGNGYGSKSGTSMATPHVAGAVALLWSAVPLLRNDIPATESYLNDYAVHLSATACDSDGWPNNLYGYGRLDIGAAVTAALADYATPPTARFTYTLPTLVNLPISFTNQSTSLVPITATWHFEDGFTRVITADTGTAIQHIYTTPADYSVTLIVSNHLGQDIAAKTLQLSPGFYFYLPLFLKDVAPKTMNREA